MEGPRSNPEDGKKIEVEKMIFLGGEGSHHRFEEELGPGGPTCG